jgi:large subunit ribosomal protein L29
MKAKDLRERSLEDLVELEKSLTRDTFQNRLKNFTNRLDDTSSMKKTRRDLARVKTILHQMRAKAPLVHKKTTTHAHATPSESAVAAAAEVVVPKPAKSKPAAPKSKPAAKKPRPRR